MILALGVPAFLGDIGVHGVHIMISVYGDEEPRIYFLVYPESFVSIRVPG